MLLINSVRQFVRRHDLLGRGTRVLAAVSGGSDSVALAHILRELDAAGELRLAGLVHFNHQLRAAAGDDERFVAALGESLGVPVLTDRDDVAARARRERRSVEDAGRAARYAFFERARALAGADVVALGHTRDDQAETFLLRLTRGAGPRGLGGMYPRNGDIVRPLLACRRGGPRAMAERPRTALRRGRDQRRRQHSAQPRAGRTAAAARGAVQPRHRRRAGRRGGTGARGLAVDGCGGERARGTARASARGPGS